MSHPAYPGHPRHEDPELTERQRALFTALLAIHNASARPVGSEMLGQHSGIPVSSATIRAELAALEESGLLERAHASSGRVPTARGFEYFVRHLMPAAALPPRLLEEVDATLLRSERDVATLLREASRLLASITHQLGLALADALDDEVLSGLDLVPLDPTRAMMVLHVGVAHVRTLALQLESPLEGGELEQVAGVLRNRLAGRRLAEVRDRLDHDPELVRDSAVRLVASAARELWSHSVSTPLLRHGLGHIAGQPEFAGSPRLAPLLAAVESGSPLDRLMVTAIEGQPSVRVGLDEDRALEGCSLVSYALPGPVPGAIGVLGPLRMDYARALAVVDAVGTRLAQLLKT